MFSVLIEFKSSAGNRLTQNPSWQLEFKMFYIINRKSALLIYEGNLCKIQYVGKSEGFLTFVLTRVPYLKGG